MVAMTARLCRGLATVCLWVAAAGLVAMTAVIGWQVFGRYVLNDTPHWSERLSLFLMLYFIMLGAAVGVRDGTHLGLVFVRNALSGRARLLADLATHGAVAAFGAVLVWFGIALARETWSHSIPTLGVSTGLSYLPFPLAGAAMVLFSAEQAIARVGRAAADRRPSAGDR